VQDCSSVPIEKRAELGFSSDENRSQLPKPSESSFGFANEAPANNAAASSFDLDRFSVRELESTSRQGGCSIADNNVAGCGGLLEPRGDVHGVAGYEGAALAGASDDDFAGVDANAQGKLIAEQLSQLSSHRESRMQRTFGVILVCNRGSERCHDSITHELLDCATRRIDLGAHRLVEPIEHRARSLGIL